MKDDPTPYSDVNAALARLSTLARATLRHRFVGMYLYGSLALGDFDPRGSDIDFIVVTDGELPASVVDALKHMHDRFDASHSPWASRIEAAYVPRDALHADISAAVRYPQLEKGGRLALDCVETGWVIQLATLREHGVAVAGPDPRSLVAPIAPGDVRRASAAHAVIWAEQARHDADWLSWVRHREALAFVVLTLCRMLYSLETGTVASKPTAARWLVQETGARWAELIHGALLGQHEAGIASNRDVEDTIALIDHTVERYRRWITR